MSDFDFSEALPPGEDGDPGREFRRVKVGDMFADDAQLHNALDEIAKLAREDRPGTGSRYIAELFDALHWGTKPLRVAWQGIAFIAKRFTNHEVRAAQAAKILSEADVNHAKADSIRESSGGDAEIKSAVAEQIRTRTQIEKYEQLKELGIDWEVDESGEIPRRIGVTKRKDDEESDDPRDES